MIKTYILFVVCVCAILLATAVVTVVMTGVASWLASRH